MSTAKNSFSGTGERKSSFATTCNRLSFYLKEKRSLRDFGIDATFDLKRKPEISSPATETNMTTVDLLSNMKFPVQSTEFTRKSVNHLPQYVKPDYLTEKYVSGELVKPTEYYSTQLTIFYRGQIMVFDHISADKARDMMLAATNASSSSSNDDDDDQVQNRIPLDQILRGLRVNGSDLPIARRSSLHKFLSKRKDRASERAPYQLHNRLMAVASLNHTFDLNF